MEPSWACGRPRGLPGFLFYYFGYKVFYWTCTILLIQYFTSYTFVSEIKKKSLSHEALELISTINKNMLLLFNI